MLEALALIDEVMKQLPDSKLLDRDQVFNLFLDLRLDMERLLQEDEAEPINEKETV